jgi:RecA/RadA recombinase
MKFSNLIQKFKSKKTLRITNNMQLREGEIVNIYGNPYVGKTTFCFYIVKQNLNKKCLYVASEELNETYKNVLKEINSNVFISYSKKLKNINNFVSVLPIDYVIIDSITALEYIENQKVIDEFFNIIITKKLNAIIVSQMKNYGNKETYEHNKLINFACYKLKIEKNNDQIILNGKNKIDFKEVWSNESRKNNG